MGTKVAQVTSVWLKNGLILIDHCSSALKILPTIKARGKFKPSSDCRRLCNSVDFSVMTEGTFKTALTNQLH